MGTLIIIACVVAFILYCIRSKKQADKPQSRKAHERLPSSRTESSNPPISKVQGLLKMALSPNESEARQASLAAYELIQRYGLPVEAYGPEIPENGAMGWEAWFNKAVHRAQLFWNEAALPFAAFKPVVERPKRNRLVRAGKKYEKPKTGHRGSKVKRSNHQASAARRTGLIEPKQKDARRALKDNFLPADILAEPLTQGYIRMANELRERYTLIPFKFPPMKDLVYIMFQARLDRN